MNDENSTGDDGSRDAAVACVIRSDRLVLPRRMDRFVIRLFILRITIYRAVVEECQKNVWMTLAAPTNRTRHSKGLENKTAIAKPF
jgi:hypothetical protein